MEDEEVAAFTTAVFSFLFGVLFALFSLKIFLGPELTPFVIARAMLAPLPLVYLFDRILIHCFKKPGITTYGAVSTYLMWTLGICENLIELSIVLAWLLLVMELVIRELRKWL